jgi:hypothetical protein
MKKKFKNRTGDEHALRVPREVCIVHNDGERLYVVPHTWQSMFDFLKEKEAFALTLEEKALHNLPGAEKSKERVWAKAHPNNKAVVSIGNALWGLNELSTKPKSSIRVLVTQVGPRVYPC